MAISDMTEAERARYFELTTYLRDNPPKLGVPDPVRYAKSVEAEGLEKRAAARRDREWNVERRLSAVERQLRGDGHGGARPGAGRPHGS